MALDVPEAYRPLAEILYERYAKRQRLSKRALRALLAGGGLFTALAALPQDERVDPAAVLAACRGDMEKLAAPPAEGWLPRCYAYLADGLFPNPAFVRPKADERQALELFLAVLGYLLEKERGSCPPSLLQDVCAPTEEELRASRVAGEYARFQEAVEGSRYLLLLRMARSVLPYDPASHIIGVQNVAVRMARQAVQCGLPVDVPLTAAAALSHDIGKFGCRGPDAARVPNLHYYYTWEWLTRRDMPEIAHVAANHSTWDLEFQNLPLESLLLIYADFRVRGHRYENGHELVGIYTLEETHGIILAQLSNMTAEKRRQYDTVYHKLWDFQRFLEEIGVDPDPLGQVRPAQTADASLLGDEAAVERLRGLAFYHNIQLMHTLSGQSSTEQLLEQARSEKDPRRLRTYLRLLEDYNVYMTREGKLLALGFLYELLMRHEGDVRRQAASIMGLILAGSGPRYRKELPARAPKGASAPAVSEVLKEATALWEHYIELCIHPDVKISAKHALRIANSLKVVVGSLFASCAPKEAPHFLAPLLQRALSSGAPLGDRCILLDALLHAPASLLASREGAALLKALGPMVREAGEERLQICALRLAEQLLEAGCPGAKGGAAALLAALPQGNEPAILWLRGRLARRLGRKAPLPAVEASELYLANLKNAVHWTVKLAYIDMLAEFSQAHRDEAFHIAMHLSNLLSVSEHLPVRQRAGEALFQVSSLLRVDQRNEIAIDLIRELETGQDEISRYIPPFLGALICSLPPKETAECTGLLEALVRSSNIRPAQAALSTLGAMLRQMEPGALSTRILGLLLTGVAHYEDGIHRTALYVLCRGFFGDGSVPLPSRRAVFSQCAKKLLSLLAEPRESRITFFNRAAMLNHLYRFITTCEVELGPWEFPVPGPPAFFPGTFDPFSAGHRRIVEEIRALGFTVYLAVDEFSWNKRTLPKLLRRKIALMSVADATDVFLFPDDIPVNIAIPADLERLTALFGGQRVTLVMGSDVVFNASAYRHGLPGGARFYDHIVFTRVEDGPQAEARHAVAERIRGKLILLSLPAYYETVSSTRIRDSIDKNMDISMLVDPVVQDFIYAKGLYLRSPLNKRELRLESLYFTGGQSPETPGLYAFTLHSREQEGPLGRIQARALPISGLYGALGSAPGAEALRQRASGRVLMIEACEACAAGGACAAGCGPDPENLLLLCNHLLARCLSDDITYAFYQARAEGDPLPSLLPQLGFLSLDAAPSLLLVDMRCPMVLVQDALCRLKEPLSADGAVIAAIRSRRPALRLALCALFPGRLLLCFDTELLNQALMHKVQDWNGVLTVPAGERRLGENMCVPYGKVLSGDIVPHTVTKALHAEKVFNPDLKSFAITESPGYSSLLNQVRTLKSFRRPVLLVDDLLHNGYRLEKLDPLFKAEEVPIARIIVGVLSGRGLDLMRTQGRAVDCEYFIPNLLYWFHESLLYPFIGGDGMGGRPMQGASIPSVNLMLPYAYPRFLHGAAEKAVWSLAKTALSNARDILKVLEARHMGLSAGTLTIRRLGEAFIAPRLPDKGAHLSYDPNTPPSQYLEEDLAALLRLSREA